MQFRSTIRAFLAEEEGPTAVEYAVMLAFIVTVCITAIGAIGTNTNVIFEDARDMLS